MLSNKIGRNTKAIQGLETQLRMITSLIKTSSNTNKSIQATSISTEALSCATEDISNIDTPVPECYDYISDSLRSISKAIQDHKNKINETCNDLAEVKSSLNQHQMILDSTSILNSDLDLQSSLILNLVYLMLDTSYDKPTDNRQEALDSVTEILLALDDTVDDNKDPYSVTSPFLSTARNIFEMLKDSNNSKVGVGTLISALSTIVKPSKVTDSTFSEPEE